MHSETILLSKPSKLVNQESAKKIYPLHKEFHALTYGGKLKFWEKYGLNMGCREVFISKDEKDKNGLTFSIYPTNDDENVMFANAIIAAHSSTLKIWENDFIKTLKKFNTRTTKLNFIQNKIESLTPRLDPVLAVDAPSIAKTLMAISYNSAVGRYRHERRLPDFRKMNAEKSEEFARKKIEIDFIEFMQLMKEKIEQGISKKSNEGFEEKERKNKKGNPNSGKYSLAEKLLILSLFENKGVDQIIARKVYGMVMNEDSSTIKSGLQKMNKFGRASTNQEGKERLSSLNRIKAFFTESGYVAGIEKVNELEKETRRLAGNAKK